MIFLKQFARNLLLNALFLLIAKEKSRFIVYAAYSNR